MLGATHRAFALTTLSTLGLAYQALEHEPVTAYFDTFAEHNLRALPVAGLLILGALMGASYPDIDQGLPIPHRGVTHNLWVAMIIGAGIYYCAHVAPHPYGAGHGLLLPGLVGVLIGYLSHLVGDAFSTSGIDWFYPLNGFKTYPNGARVVRGHRFIFQPLYRVGSPWMGISGKFFWGIAALITTTLWLFRI